MLSALPAVPPMAPAHPPRLLQLARITQYLPQLAGLSLLLGCYQRLFPAGTVFRIDDFDGDLKLDVNVCETIGINLWHAPKLYEHQERELFCSAVKPGCTVLDVGANVGIYTLLACKRGARVFSIEADPRNADALRKHVQLNHFADRVSIYQLAATAQNEDVMLYRNPFNSGGSSLYAPSLHGPSRNISSRNGPPRNGSSQGGSSATDSVGGEVQPVSVSGRSIDSLRLPGIDICKIDVEGAELRVLEGMTDTLRRSPDMNLLVECFKDGPSLVRFLRQHFEHISLVGRNEVVTGELPPCCNLWAWNSKPGAD